MKKLSGKCSSCGKTGFELVDGLCAPCLAGDPATLPPTPRSAEQATMAPSSDISAPGSFQPREFGDYELLQEIARGGMGIVYKARQKKLNRIVALKMILGGKFSSTEDLQRFHIEAQAAAKLDHPGIVPVYEIGEVEGQAFFAMKYIEGGSLSDHLGRLKNDTEAAVKVLIRVAEAVHHAHQRGILHRDLKPANILIDENGEPLITDLGLAKSTAGDSKLTHTGAVLGTPSYMPPEQASGEAVTTAADTYSIGAIMYELLTGQPPYHGASTVEVVMKVVEGSPELPSRINRSVDRDLELICLHCLERSGDDRYESAGELADDLRAWLHGESLSVKAPTLAAQIGRWFRKNQQLVYIGFAMLAGCVFCVPFLIMIGTGSAREVYTHFPQDQKPVLYRMGEVPEWIQFASMVLLFFVIWPMFGFMNAMIAKPVSLRAAAGRGLVTSFIFGLVFFLALGWMVLVQTVSNNNDKQVRALTNSVWPADGNREVAIAQAEKMYEGLDAISEDQRASIVASRIYFDGISSGLEGLLILMVLTMTFTTPIFYGTVFGSILLRRDTKIFVSVLRYLIAWWTFSFTACFCFLWYVDLRKDEFVDYPVVFWIVMASSLLVLYLTMRVWRKADTHVAETPSNSSVVPVG